MFAVSGFAHSQPLIDCTTEEEHEPGRLHHDESRGEAYDSRRFSKNALSLPQTSECAIWGTRLPVGGKIFAHQSAWVRVVHGKPR